VAYKKNQSPSRRVQAKQVRDDAAKERREELKLKKDLKKQNIGKPKVDDEGNLLTTDQWAEQQRQWAKEIEEQETELLTPDQKEERNRTPIGGWNWRAALKVGGTGLKALKLLRTAGNLR
jgi:hypothetical protein